MQAIEPKSLSRIVRCQSIMVGVLHTHVIGRLDTSQQIILTGKLFV